jgi:hypothetical protein
MFNINFYQTVVIIVVLDLILDYYDYLYYKYYDMN